MSSFVFFLLLGKAAEYLLLGPSMQPALQVAGCIPGKEFRPHLYPFPCGYCRLQTRNPFRALKAFRYNLSQSSFRNRKDIIQDAKAFSHFHGHIIRWFNSACSKICDQNKPPPPPPSLFEGRGLGRGLNLSRLLSNINLYNIGWFL